MIDMAAGNAELFRIAKDMRASWARDAVAAQDMADIIQRDVDAGYSAASSRIFAGRYRAAAVRNWNNAIASGFVDC